MGNKVRGHSMEKWEDILSETNKDYILRNMARLKKHKRHSDSIVASIPVSNKWKNKWQRLTGMDPGICKLLLPNSWHNKSWIKQEIHFYLMWKRQFIFCTPNSMSKLSLGHFKLRVWNRHSNSHFQHRKDWLEKQGVKHNEFNGHPRTMLLIIKTKL